MQGIGTGPVDAGLAGALGRARHLARQRGELRRLPPSATMTRRWRGIDMAGGLLGNMPGAPGSARATGTV